MKKFLILVLMVLFVVPYQVKADVVSTNFADTVAEEIETFSDTKGYEDYISTLNSIDLSNYNEDDSKVNVYIFRGSTCGYCLQAISYFASIASEYGNYFNLITYEVWSNSDNASLMKQVANVLGDTVSGVPYIVIGDKSFTGYSESMDSSIISQIMEVYNSKEKYDVMDHLNDEDESSGNANSTYIILFGIIIILILASSFYFGYKFNQLERNINTILDSNTIEKKNNSIRKLNKNIKNK